METWNAKITATKLAMEDHGYLVADIVLEGSGVGCVFGGYCIGKGYLGADEFKGSEKGTEYIMHIMDVVGVSKWEDLKNKYVRVRGNGWGKPVKCIGNIIEDKWFDAEKFFNDN